MVTKLTYLSVAFVLPAALHQGQVVYPPAYIVHPSGTSMLIQMFVYMWYQKSARIPLQLLCKCSEKLPLFGTLQHLSSPSPGFDLCCRLRLPADKLNHLIKDFNSALLHSLQVVKAVQKRYYAISRREELIPLIEAVKWHENLFTSFQIVQQHQTFRNRLHSNARVSLSKTSFQH